MLLELVNEDLGYDQGPVLRDISIAIRPGDRIALIGESGAGKSTLLAAIQSRLGRQAALVPQNAYGTIAESALNRAAGRAGGSVVALDRFPRTGTGVQSASTAMAGKVLNQSNNIQALFLPEGGELLSAAGRALTAGGVQPGTIKMLGTGLWDDAATARVALANGGWYAGVSPQLVSRFDGRYQSTYGSRPHRIASLAYDAVSLAVTASKQAGSGQSLDRVITNSEGYKGVNGLFRFRRNGLIQRGLSILEVTPTGPQVISAAPDRFSAGL